MKPTMAVLGGDMRQVYLAQLLAAGGRDIVTWGLEKGGAPCAAPLHRALEAQVLILPLPVCRGDALNLPLTDTRLEAEELWSRLRPGQLLLGGMAGELPARLREERGLTLLDYYGREELQIANAVPTALAVGHRGNVRGAEKFWESLDCKNAAAMV